MKQSILNSNQSQDVLFNAQCPLSIELIENIYNSMIFTEDQNFALQACEILYKRAKIRNIDGIELQNLEFYINRKN